MYLKFFELFEYSSTYHSKCMHMHLKKELQNIKKFLKQSDPAQTRFKVTKTSVLGFFSCHFYLLHNNINVKKEKVMKHLVFFLHTAKDPFKKSFLLKKYLENIW